MLRPLCEFESWADLDLPGAYAASSSRCLLKDLLLGDGKLPRHVPHREEHRKAWDSCPSSMMQS